MDSDDLKVLEQMSLKDARTKAYPCGARSLISRCQSLTRNRKRGHTDRMTYNDELAEAYSDRNTDKISVHLSVSSLRNHPSMTCQVSVKRVSAHAKTSETKKADP